MPSKKKEGTKDNGVSIAGKNELDVLAWWNPRTPWKENTVGVSSVIGITEEEVAEIAYKIISGRCVPASMFDSSSREKKNEVYFKFASNAHEYLNNDLNTNWTATTNYIGLPAGNSVDIISRFQEPQTIYIFEKDYATRNLIMMRDAPVLLAKVALYTGGEVDVYPDDILEWFDTSVGTTRTLKFNVYDLDLMCHLTYKKIQQITTGLVKHGEKKIVMNLVTSYGHKLKKQHYIDNLRPLLRQEIGTYFKIDKHEFGTYCDRRIPMFFETMSLSRD